MTPMFRVLVADSIAVDGLAPLRDDERFELVVRPGLSPAELADAIADADAVLVRSATRITRESLARADRLKAIGRAGVGVDTIDVDAATERGIPVLTAPAGNTISAAELTFALLLALARRVPAADRSMKAGEWDRKTLSGIELHGKTLGLIGAGRIGGEVATRARAFGMRVLAFDPFLSAERARVLDVEAVALDDLLARADVVSVHVPLTEATSNLIGEPQLARMKKGALILNVARGGVVNESALIAALEAGHLGGAALDVYETEPLPRDHPFRQLTNVVLTPHLGASTAEAQQNVAIEIAEAVRSALLDGDMSRAVNAPAVGGDEMRRLRPMLELAERLASVAVCIADGPITGIEVRYAGGGDAGMRMLSASAVTGALAVSHGEEDVNMVSALHIARARGIVVEQVRHDVHPPYKEHLEVRVRGDAGESRVAGALLGESHPRIVRVDEFHVDMAPRGTLLVIRSKDLPGILGSVGTVLGRAGINIAEYHQSRQGNAGQALALVGVDRHIPEAVIAELRNLGDIVNVKQVRLDSQQE
jgi:D-3-phosphoglycerate dehydrogenase / 2-oxoglutarate reductase